MAENRPGNLTMERHFHGDAAAPKGAIVTSHKQSGMV
jgi:hypothetical protein